MSVNSFAFKATRILLINKKYLEMEPCLLAKNNMLIAHFLLLSLGLRCKESRFFYLEYYIDHRLTIFLTKLWLESKAAKWWESSFTSNIWLYWRGTLCSFCLVFCKRETSLHIELEQLVLKPPSPIPTQEVTGMLDISTPPSPVLQSMLRFP